MTVTYTPIASQTLTTSASSVTFSSIPGDYRDLVLVSSPIRSSAADLRITLNGDSTDSNYSRVTMIGFGTSTLSDASATRQIGLGGPTTDRPTNIKNIMDYSVTDKHKTIIWRGDLSGVSTRASATRWANTAAITSISLAFSSGDLEAGSTFALYGIVS